MGGEVEVKIKVDSQFSRCHSTQAEANAAHGTRSCSGGKMMTSFAFSPKQTLSQGFKCDGFIGEVIPVECGK